MFQGEGYDCGRDSFNGDGLWSKVAGQREWVESQLLEGLTLGVALLNSTQPVLFFFTQFCFDLGELRLHGGTGEVDGDLAKGNVYLDGNPVCDAGWSQEDALVACRW